MTYREDLENAIMDLYAYSEDDLLELGPIDEILDWLGRARAAKLFEYRPDLKPSWYKV